jgi:hypothetical protein
VGECTDSSSVISVVTSLYNILHNAKVLFFFVLRRGLPPHVP